MLPSENDFITDKNQLYLDNDISFFSTLRLSINPSYFNKNNIRYHLYVIMCEDINLGLFPYSNEYDNILPIRVDNQKNVIGHKIIGSTDNKLNLPLISMSNVMHFVDIYNNGTSSIDVNIEFNDVVRREFSKNDNYDIILVNGVIMKKIESDKYFDLSIYKTPKLTSNNEIIIKNFINNKESNTDHIKNIAKRFQRFNK